MGRQILPEFVRTYYQVHNRKHTIAILNNDFSGKYTDIIGVSGDFRLKRSVFWSPGVANYLIQRLAANKREVR